MQQSGWSPSSAYLADRQPIDLAQAAQNISVLGVDRTGGLINTLLVWPSLIFILAYCWLMSPSLQDQADGNAIALMAQGNAQHIEQGKSLTGSDRQALLAMKARIDMLLGIPMAEAKEDSVTSVAISTEEPASDPISAQEAESTTTVEPPNSLTPTKVIPASDDDDTDADEPPIATPVTSAHEKADGSHVAVAPAELSPGALEADSGPKTAPAPSLLNGGKLEAKDVIPTPSTSPAATQAGVENALPASQGVADLQDAGEKTESEDWTMDLD